MHFFGAFPNADWQLLSEGWTVAHITVPELYANAEAQRRFDALYEFMITLGYAEKTVPVGYSRGGLDAYSWSARNPEKVACIYADNPVCDIKSWPCSRNPEEWAKYAACADNCMRALNLTPETLESYHGNPLDPEVLKPIADAAIPVLHLLGEADEVVPPEENTDALVPIFAALGGQISVIRKPGAKHHPHCLEEPSPITEFVKGAFYSRK
jgi:pimeloyl-ACP methyl ester carboxylesterase